MSPPIDADIASLEPLWKTLQPRYCFPGASLEDITASIDEVTKDASSNTLYAIHAGTNDVQHNRSEELMAK